MELVYIVDLKSMPVMVLGSNPRCAIFKIEGDN